MEIIDHRLVGALHEAVADHDVFQTSTIEALLDGAYEGDLTIGELLRHGDLGIGTVDHLDGELIVLDGEALVARADGRVDTVDPSTTTPFAVVCHFAPGPPVTLGRLVGVEAVTAAIDAARPPGADVVAIRLDGQFEAVEVRSVARQSPPFPPLREVVARQATWSLTDVAGTVVGFGFPTEAAGVEVPGWHLHLLTEDRTAGGHVTDLTLARGTLRLDGTRALHLELPAAVGLRAGGPGRRDEIDEVEGRS